MSSLRLLATWWIQVKIRKWPVFHSDYLEILCSLCLELTVPPKVFFWSHGSPQSLFPVSVLSDCVCVCVLACFRFITSHSNFCAMCILWLYERLSCTVRKHTCAPLKCLFALSSLTSPDIKRRARSQPQPRLRPAPPWFQPVVVPLGSAQWVVSRRTWKERTETQFFRWFFSHLSTCQKNMFSILSWEISKKKKKKVK